MKKLLIPILLIILVAFTVCSLFGSGDDDGPAIPGKIVFSTVGDSGGYQIFTMNANGADIKQLTNFENEEAFQPSWSPDGTQIVFTTTLNSSSNGFSIYIMNADGSNKHPMHSRPGSPIPTPGAYPRWSPDGSQIAWQHCVNCQIGTNIEIFIYTFATDSVRQLTRSGYPVTNTNPTWSPDGSRIAFVSDRDYVEADTLRFRRDLYVMDANGSNQRRVTETGYAREPTWKPDSDIIIFRSTGSAPGLYKVNTEYGKIVKVKDDLNNRTHLHPNAWGSDGRQLLITARLLDPPNTNSLYIFDVINSSFEKIYSKSSNNNNQVITGADLHESLN